MATGYAALKADGGRRPIYYVEIELPKCSEVYGTSPCTASLGVTGDIKCYNTLRTCQDKSNFNSSATYKLRFASQRIDDLQTSGDCPTFPTLTGTPTITPTILDPGKGLGVRSRLSVSIQDHPWDDQYVDPYIDDRTHGTSAGSFWGKLIRRFRYFEGRKITLFVGFLEEDGSYHADNFESRAFFIENIGGPGTSGAVTITAKDILQFASKNKTQIPTPSDGYLDGDVTASATTLQLGLGEAAQYSIGDYARINSEVLYISAVNTGLDQLTVTRATLPSFYADSGIVAAEHSDGDLVQKCVVFDDRVDDIVYDILVNYVGINSSYINFTDWQDLADDWAADLELQRLITEPQSAADLLNEIAELMVFVWWDDRAEKIKFDVLKPVANNSVPTLTDDSHILADSLNVTVDAKLRYSQFWIYYGQLNPTENKTEERNYRRGPDVYADLDSETEDEYGSSSIKKVFSPWLPAGKTAVALEISSRFVQFYRDSKTVVQLSLDAKDGSLEVGDMVNVQSRYIQGDTGEPEQTFFLVTQLKENLDTRSSPGIQVTGINNAVNGRCTLIAPNGTPDYESATDEQKLYGFICDTTTKKMPNGDPPYLIC